MRAHDHADSTDFCFPPRAALLSRPSASQISISLLHQVVQLALLEVQSLRRQLSCRNRRRILVRCLSLRAHHGPQSLIVVPTALSCVSEAIVSSYKLGTQRRALGGTTIDFKFTSGLAGLNLSNLENGRFPKQSRAKFRTEVISEICQTFARSFVPACRHSANL